MVDVCVRAGEERASERVFEQGKAGQDRLEMETEMEAKMEAEMVFGEG